MLVPAFSTFEALKQYTNARVGIGHRNGSLPTSELLRFQQAHARARDAVDTSLNLDELSTALRPLCKRVEIVHSAAVNRQNYLRQPFMGRMLSDLDAARLQVEGFEAQSICWVIADGLSAEAVNSQAVSLLQYFQNFAPAHFMPSVIFLAQQSRVALADQLALISKAQASVILIGERPGLSSPQSMGVYYTYDPQAGTTDEKRNCISNIHEHGLSTEEAARQLYRLLQASFQAQLSGVQLKIGQSQQEL